MEPKSLWNQVHTRLIVSFKYKIIRFFKTLMDFKGLKFKTVTSDGLNWNIICVGFFLNGAFGKMFGNIYRHFTVLTEKTMRIKVHLHKNFQHILLGSSEKSWAYLISAPFFLIDFYLVESIVSFAKKCSTTLKWLPYRHSGHFKWSKRDFFLKENQALKLLREKKSHFE